MMLHQGGGKAGVCTGEADVSLDTCRCILGYLRRYPISLLAFINLDVTGWFVPHRESADPFQAFFRCRIQELCPRYFLLTQSLA